MTFFQCERHDGQQYEMQSQLAWKMMEMRKTISQKH